MSDACTRSREWVRMFKVFNSPFGSVGATVGSVQPCWIGGTVGLDGGALKGNATVGFGGGALKGIATVGFGGCNL